MHERLSVSGLCFPDADLGATIERLEELGVGTTTIQAAKVRAFGWDAGVERLAGTSVGVAGFVDGLPTFELGAPDSWDATRSRMIATLDAAASLGARTVYILTGRLRTPRGDAAPWHESATAFVEAVEPVAVHARSVGVRLAVEPTNPLYADFNIVHSLGDALRLLDECDLGVCLDLFHVWTEAQIDEHIAGLGDRIALVQVSDQVLGDDLKLVSAVPGDGLVPLRRTLQAVLDTGYDGPIDLELYGPHIDAQGRTNALRRSITWLEAVLVDLGLPAHRPAE